MMINAENLFVDTELKFKDKKHRIQVLGALIPRQRLIDRARQAVIMKLCSRNIVLVFQRREFAVNFRLQHLGFYNFVRGGSGGGVGWCLEGRMTGLKKRFVKTSYIN